MGIANEILRLRRNQASSVQALIGAVDWCRAGYTTSREYAVREMADIVLLNVAAHAQIAAELLKEAPTKPPSKTRRSILPWRKSRHSDEGHLSHQRRLFA